MTKVLKTKIKDDGELIEIETDRDDDFKFVWINADDLEDIAIFVEKCK